MSDIIKKRGPGRPPNKPLLPSIDKNGIVTSPKNSNHRLELIHNDPNIFKSLFNYFKNIKAREIHLRCDNNGLTFFTKDHSKTLRIIANIFGKNVNWYYCNSTFWLGINKENIEKIFSSIDKTFFSIILLQSYDDINCLNIILKDIELDKECNYNIVLSSYIDDNELYEAENIINTDEFLLEFILSSKQFKKTVNDAINFSETITFEKIGNNPLQLSYIKSNISYYEIYKSNDKIMLKSKISDHNTFRAIIKLNNIKSLANSMITDDIKILYNFEHMLFQSIIDSNVLTVNTLYNIE